MAAKKENPKAKKASSKKASPDKLREDHPLKPIAKYKTAMAKAGKKAGQMAPSKVKEEATIKAV
jgi:hypothetical protein